MDSEDRDLMTLLLKDDTYRNIDYDATIDDVMGMILAGTLTI